MARNLTAKIELDGEKEYKAALKELNTANRALSSELKKIDAEFKGNTDSLEYLTKQQEALIRAYDQQQKQVDFLRKAVKEHAEANKENSQITQEWIIKLNYAEAKLFDIQHSLEDNRAALDRQAEGLSLAGEETKGFGDLVGELSQTLGVTLPQNVSEALNSMGSFSAGMVAAMGAATAGITAFIEATKALYETTVQVASDLDDVITNSMISGLSTTLLQELEYAAPLIDVDVETITGSLRKLTPAMYDAANGNSELQEKFEKLGVSVTDSNGELRSAEDVFFEIIDALGEMGNETERNAVAQDLLGRSAQDLAPIWKQGSSVLREYLEAADENYVLTSDQIEALAALDDQIQLNNNEWEALKKQIAAQFAPAATEALKAFGDIVSKAGQALVDSGITEAISTAFTVFIQMSEPLRNLIDLTNEWYNPLKQVADALKAISVTLATVMDLGDAINPLNWLTGKAQTALGWNRNSGEYSRTQKALGMDKTAGNYYNVATGMWEGNYGHNAGGNDWWRGGLTWVGEAGPELVSIPNGAQILSAQESRAAAPIYIGNITLDAHNVKDFTDIVNLVKDSRIISRMH